MCRRAITRQRAHRVRKPAQTALTARKTEHMLLVRQVSHVMMTAVMLTPGQSNALLALFALDLWHPRSSHALQEATQPKAQPSALYVLQVTTVQRQTIPRSLAQTDTTRAKGGHNPATSVRKVTNARQRTRLSLLKGAKRGSTLLSRV